MRGKNTWLLVFVSIVLIGGIVLAYSLIKNPQEDKDTVNKSRATLSSNFTGEKPEFTVYYPSSAPAGMNIDKGSIKSAKDLFTFKINQNGKQYFAVSEQSAAENFNLKDFKKKLTSATDFDSSLGSGVFGVLNEGLITAVKTKDDTLIIINCTATICLGPSQQIVKNMKVVSDIDKL